MNDVENYLGEFFTNIEESLNLERDRGDIRDIYERDVVKTVESEVTGFEMSTEDVTNIVGESAEERSGSLGAIQSRFHLFEDCQSWQDVFKKLRNCSSQAYKEGVLIQTFAAGVTLVVLDEMNPKFKYVVGPLLIKTGYKNSKILKKMVKETLIEDYTKVDYNKGNGFI